MNTKDREYMEKLNNSIAEVNKSIVLLGKHVTTINDRLYALACKVSPRESSSETMVEAPASLPDLDMDRGLEMSTPSEVVADEFQTRAIQNSAKVNSKTNLFVDDGSLHRDSDNITPKVELQPRTRQSAQQLQTEVTCQRCHRSSRVSSVHARDYFVCDRCITGRK